MSSEELRQNVFSSIHMSVLAKRVQVSLTYPSCTFCGGTLVGSSSKSSPKRKSALCQLSLYTNSSESFIVWCKKQDEPKGMLWMRSCCVRKGLDENAVELISRGCRGRCSYTLKFSSTHASDEWYKLLKQESRKIPYLGDELPASSGGLVDDQSYMASLALDSMLTDTSPLSVLNEVLHGGSSGEEDDSENQEESQDQVTPLALHTTQTTAPNTITTSSSKSSKTPKSKTVKSKLKSNPVISLQGLSAKSRKSSVIPICSSSLSNSTVSSFHPLDSIENTSNDDYLSRWSWPMKA